EPPVNMPWSLWTLAYGRGCRSKQDLDNLLTPKLRDLKPPLSLHGMDEAVERLVKAFETHETIGIYGDFDLDGTPGVALLKSGLEGLGYKNLTWAQARRLTDGYGFHKKFVDLF